MAWWDIFVPYPAHLLNDLQPLVEANIYLQHRCWCLPRPSHWWSLFDEPVANVVRSSLCFIFSGSLPCAPALLHHTVQLTTSNSSLPVTSPSTFPSEQSSNTFSTTFFKWKKKTLKGKCKLFICIWFFGWRSSRENNFFIVCCESCCVLSNWVQKLIDNFLNVVFTTMEISKLDIFVYPIQTEI